YVDYISKTSDEPNGPSPNPVNHPFSTNPKIVNSSSILERYPLSIAFWVHSPMLRSHSGLYSVATVGMPPSIFSGLRQSINALLKTCLCRLSLPVGPLTNAKIRSIALDALSSYPVVMEPSFGAYVASSKAAASGLLESVLKYRTGRPKLNPCVSLSVTVSPY